MGGSPPIPSMNGLREKHRPDTVASGDEKMREKPKIRGGKAFLLFLFFKEQQHERTRILRTD